MESAATSPQLSSLLPNDVLGRIERMRIQATRRFTNRSRGEQLRRKGGSSTEFVDYRDYVEGDDTRFVDWNIFARLHRPYLKQYQLEEETHLVLLVDASSSMNFEDKLLRAKQLAAAFGVMGLFAHEKVSCYAFVGRDGKMPMMPPTRGRGSMRKLLAFIESIEAGGDATIEVGVETLLKHHRGRGCIAIASDFLTTKDLAPGFNRLYSSGLELLALQVLCPAELNPEVLSDLRLVDSESDELLDVTVTGELMAIYREYRDAYMGRVERLARQRQGKAAVVNSKDGIREVLFDQLRRKGFLA